MSYNTAHKLKTAVQTWENERTKENWDKERLENIVVQLNSLDWGSMGFKQGKRYIFSQRALKNCLLPRSTVKTVQLKSS